MFGTGSILDQMRGAPRPGVFGIRSPGDFAEALGEYLKAAREVHARHMVLRGHIDPQLHRGLLAESWRLDFGKVRVRIVHDGGARAFVDYATGDIFKPAGWKAPAKHARGNIYSAGHGAETEGPYGPAYLR